MTEHSNKWELGNEASISNIEFLIMPRRFDLVESQEFIVNRHWDEPIKKFSRLKQNFTKAKNSLHSLGLTKNLKISKTIANNHNSINQNFTATKIAMHKPKAQPGGFNFARRNSEIVETSRGPLTNHQKLSIINAKSSHRSINGGTLGYTPGVQTFLGRMQKNRRKQPFGPKNTLSDGRLMNASLEDIKTIYKKTGPKWGSVINISDSVDKNFLISEPKSRGGSKTQKNSQGRTEFHENFKK
jgi:hypothetical protein